MSERDVSDALIAAKNLFDAIKRINKIGKNVNLVSRTAQTADLEATDEKLNNMRSLGRQWNAELFQMRMKTENDWVQWSGTNLFQPNEATQAVKNTKELMDKMLALKEACDGLATLAEIVFIADNMNIKGLAKLDAPDLIVMDRYVKDEVVKEFKSCALNADYIANVLKRVLHGLEDTRILSIGLSGEQTHLRDRDTSHDGHNPPGRQASTPGSW